MGLEALSTRLFDTLSAAGGVLVTYARGGASVEVQAVPAVTSYEGVDSDGMALTIQGRDYLVKAADLVLSGLETLPARFDTVTEDGEVYEVRKPGGGREYDYTDQYKQVLRIHTLDKNAGD